MASTTRLGYTAAQIKQFYSRIGLPSSYCHEPGSASTRIANSPEEGLAFLSTLQRYTLASVPFENLDLHYSPHHAISIDPDHLFEKVVERRDGKGGRGGYCMQNNALFGNVLLGLGYNLMATGARINAGAQPSGGDKSRYSGWSHMINIVNIAGSKYAVDIGFGGGGPTQPMPLVHDQPVLNLGPAQMVRYLHTALPENSSPDQRFWVYEKRNSEEEEYAPCYCFTEVEFFPADFEVMNHWTSTSRSSWFVSALVCVKWHLSDDGEKVVGQTTLFQDTLKRRIGDNSESPMEIKTESDRVEALEKYFDIPLTEAERKGIHNLASALPS